VDCTNTALHTRNTPVRRVSDTGCENKTFVFKNARVGNNVKSGVSVRRSASQTPSVSQISHSEDNPQEEEKTIKSFVKSSYDDSPNEEEEEQQQQQLKENTQKCFDDDTKVLRQQCNEMSSSGTEDRVVISTVTNNNKLLSSLVDKQEEFNNDSANKGCMSGPTNLFQLRSSKADSIPFLEDTNGSELEKIELNKTNNISPDSTSLIDRKYDNSHVVGGIHGTHYGTENTANQISPSSCTDVQRYSDVVTQNVRSVDNYHKHLQTLVPCTNKTIPDFNKNTLHTSPEGLIGTPSTSSRCTAVHREAVPDSLPDTEPSKQTYLDSHQDMKRETNDKLSPPLPRDDYLPPSRDERLTSSHHLSPRSFSIYSRHKYTLKRKLSLTETELTKIKKRRLDMGNGEDCGALSDSDSSGDMDISDENPSTAVHSGIVECSDVSPSVEDSQLRWSNGLQVVEIMLIEQEFQETEEKIESLEKQNAFEIFEIDAITEIKECRVKTMKVSPCDDDCTSRRAIPGKDIRLPGQTRDVQYKPLLLRAEEDNTNTNVTHECNTDVLQDNDKLSSDIQAILEKPNSARGTKPSINPDHHDLTSTSHDLTSTSHDINTSHDITNTSHDITSTSHDLTSTSHDITNTSHDITNTSHDITNTSHDLTNTSHDLTNTSHDLTSTSHDLNTSHDITNTSHDITSTSHDLTSTSHDINTSHDITNTSHDLTNTSHDITNTSHDITNTSHDITNTSHDITNTSHDITSTSHDITSTSHDITNTSHDLINTSHDLTSTSHDLTSTSHDLTNPVNLLSNETEIKTLFANSMNNVNLKDSNPPSLDENKTKTNDIQSDKKLSRACEKAPMSLSDSYRPSIPYCYNGSSHLLYNPPPLKTRRLINDNPRMNPTRFHHEAPPRVQHIPYPPNHHGGFIRLPSLPINGPWCMPHLRPPLPLPLPLPFYQNRFPFRPPFIPRPNMAHYMCYGDARKRVL
jgi:hypothetical protein